MAEQEAFVEGTSSWPLWEQLQLQWGLLQLQWGQIQERLGLHGELAPVLMTFGVLLVTIVLVYLGGKFFQFFSLFLLWRLQWSERSIDRTPFLRPFLELLDELF